MGIDIDLSEAKAVFMAESAELLQEMENLLLALEADPDDTDTINSLFRAAHTIKGSAGVLGIETVERFTHGVENLLTKVRDGEIKLTPDMGEILLECRDHISALVGFAGSNEAVPAEAEERGKRLSRKVGAFLAVGVAPAAAEPATAKPVASKSGARARTDLWHISIRFGENVLRNGLDPISFIGYLGRLGEVKKITTILDRLPSLDALDPEACYLGFEISFKSDFDKKAIEDVFEFVREDAAIHILPPSSRMDEYIELINRVGGDSVRLGEILVEGGTLTQAELDSALASQATQNAATPPAGGTAQKLGEMLVSGSVVHPEVVEAALEKQKKNVAAKAAEAKTIRVDAAKLDTLINLVGELVISTANVGQHSSRIKDASLLESASIMARLVEDVRDSSMRLRMVPIGETFNRFNRVLRDISRESGKEIELAISGAETELDKTVIEKISDPLMHLVRNAADHGLERPDERLAAGKPERGTVRLNAFNDAGAIVIEVADDGRGLNRAKILKKAVDAGLAAEGQELSDREVFKLIFEPGLSTAEEVTKLSGRGVGMDVVRRNIEALRGDIDIESTAGAGTTMRIRLPLTLAIIDGFMVGVASAPYVIPLDLVVECVELPASASASRRSYINLRGEVLPYIRLREFFGSLGSWSGVENVVVVQHGGQKVGLVVDELFGEVQTVIKSLGRVYKNVKGLAGATIMGDGRVALILDVPSLVQSAAAAENKCADSG